MQATRCRRNAVRLISVWTVAVGAVLVIAGLKVANGQVQPFWHKAEEFPPYYEQRDSGQNIAPVFEGWQPNPDGSADMLFGYFNRNWKEQPHIPIGPDNNIKPSGPDHGQPTHFFPRRNKFVFRVRVPKDFGDSELVWTLTVNGKTEQAYATFHPQYLVDKALIQVNNTMSFPREMWENVAPVVRLHGDSRRTVKIGQSLSLNATVTDDGLLPPRNLPATRPSSSDRTAVGLRVAWFVYRGPADEVTFSPEQFTVYQDRTPSSDGGRSPNSPGWAPPPIPPDNRFPVTVTFRAPGTFVIRLMAHDGGLDTTKDTNVTVLPVGLP